jgi:FlaA1/EpsC-like NDP-sugar epimerase
LSGLEPGRDIDIVFTGIRPGEKLREELWEPDKIYEKTAHPEIFRSEQESLIQSDSLGQTLDKFELLVNESRPESIIQLLDETIPGAAIRETPSPADMTSVF